jgi:preprotein translocase subunit SecA
MRIKKTCNKGNITLMTNPFGRGTDFIVYDETIFKIDHGGLHVIQTFISVDQS